MQSRTCILSAFTLSTSIAFGAAAVAADLPKSGNYNLEFNGYGTFSVTMIGKGAAWPRGTKTVPGGAIMAASAIT
jgi:hypothetical protein